MRSIMMVGALLIGSCTLATADWVPLKTIDRLTGERGNRFTNRGSGAIRQFGRSVSATMVLGCANVFQDKRRSEDYYVAVILFSEPVGVADARMRYRFDAGSVHDITADFCDRGDVLEASWPKNIDEFIPELRPSKKLRMELDLPWAGSVLLEFNTRGADKALDQIPCGENQPAEKTR
jgi:hypothetical protein